MSPAESRKKRTEKFLRENSIPINPTLPPLPDESSVTLRPIGETVRRAVCAMMSSLAAFTIRDNPGNPKENAAFATICGGIRNLGLEGELTPFERIFYNTTGCQTAQEQQIIDMCWSMERAIPLFWAAGFISGDLPFPNHKSRLIGKIINKLDINSVSIENIIKNAKMRSVSEVLENADQCLRMDWACYESNLMRRYINLNPDVLQEQHRGFSWLLYFPGSEDWDNIII